MSSAPLRTARITSQGSVRTAAPPSLAHARAWIEATVSEQIALDRAGRDRADVTEAIRRAKRGKQASLRDLDLHDPAHLAEFNRAYQVVIAEEERLRRESAVQFAVKRLRGRWPK
jgi:hypothetical protein